MSDYLEVPLSDGRTIEVLLGGDPDGFPLLWHGGSPSAAVPFDRFDAAVAAAGLRLVTLSRPGYGASTPRPLPADRAPAYADDVPDTLAVLAHLGLDRVLCAGWSGGGPRALACAALLPHRVVAAASVAGVAPSGMPDLDWSAGMAPENQAEYAAAAAGAQAYEAYLSEDFAGILEAGPADVVASLGALLTEVDRAVVDDEVAQWLTDVFHKAAAQGVRGVRDDGLAAVAPWGFDLADVTVPVSIWQGSDDAMVPPTHGAWLAAHVPGARAHLLDGEGHLTLVTTRLGDVLADLRDLAGL